MLSQSRSATKYRYFLKIGKAQEVVNFSEMKTTFLWIDNFSHHHNGSPEREEEESNPRIQITKNALKTRNFLYVYAIMCAFKLFRLEIASVHFLCPINGAF